jgi:hypothetical protein
MGLEDLAQLLIALAVLFGLVGGGRKKRPPERPQPPQRRRPPEARRAEAPRAIRLEARDHAAHRGEPARRRPEPRQPLAQRAPRDLLSDEIYRILRGEAETRREESLEVEGGSLELERARPEFTPRQPTEDIRSIEQATDAEAYSLETLEPAGEASHREFHSKYIEPTQPPSTSAAAATSTTPRTHRLTLGARNLRQAILWKEILGPPKGMQ